MAEKASGSGGQRRRGGGSARGAESAGEFRYSDEIGTAFIDGVTFRSKPVQYLVVDGFAVVEGDIVLGTVEQVRQRTEMRTAEIVGGPVAAGVVVTGAQFRWPNCQVPYEIESGFSNPQRVTDAIAHWESNTSFRFVPRTSANAAQFPDFVEFVGGSGCSSFVGRQGGRQTVTLGSGCSTGNCIHEIGHVVGLWHEQSREDRDAFVTIQWANIIPSAVNNFAQHIFDGDDVGTYDYGSIMHYPRDAFSANGQDTIVPTDPNAQIGQRVALSAGDIAAAASLCPKALPKEFPKDPPKEFIKEFPKDRPKEFIKEFPKDRPKEFIKEFPKDPPKEFPKDGPKEFPKDPVKERPKDPPKDFPKDPPNKEFVKDGVLDPKGLFEPPKHAFDPPKGVLDPPKGVFDPPKSGAFEPPGPFVPGPGPSPFVLATGPAGWEGEAAPPAAGGPSLLDAYRQLIACYAQLDSQGLLGPRDLAAWQQCATEAQRLAAAQGLA